MVSFWASINPWKEATCSALKGKNIFTFVHLVALDLAVDYLVWENSWNLSSAIIHMAFRIGQRD